MTLQSLQSVFACSNPKMLLTEATLGFWLATISAAFLSFLIGWVVYQRFLSPYEGIPGPFWASISRFWYLQRIEAGDMHRVTKELHRIYGTSEMNSQSLKKN